MEKLNLIEVQYLARDCPRERVSAGTCMVGRGVQWLWAQRSGPCCGQGSLCYLTLPGLVPEMRKHWMKWRLCLPWILAFIHLQLNLQLSPVLFLCSFTVEQNNSNNP